MMMEIEEVYAKLGFNNADEGRNVLTRMVAENENGTLGAISHDYSSTIISALADDVAEGIAETADPFDWNMDDLRMAFGRVLCKKLNLEV